MKKVLILSSFERSIKKLTFQERQNLSKSLEDFNYFLIYGKMSPGLGFKKINHDKYEFRVDIRLRVVVKIEGDNIFLVLVGDHEEVRRYLRRFR